MKQHVLLFVAVTAAAAGCGKSSDLAPMAAEAKGIAEAYQGKVTELDKRAKDILRRGQDLKLEADSPANDQIYDAVKTLIPGMQAVVRDAMARIPKLVADDKLDELRIYSHQMEDRLESDWVKANTKLDTAEAWLFRAESRPRAPQPAAAPTQAPEPAAAPAPAASPTP